MNKQVKEFREGRPAPTYQDIIRGDSTPVSEILALQANPPQDSADVPFEHYISPEFFQLEMEKLWPYAWLVACREEYLREDGDYYVYDIGRYSILLVRQADGSIKGYHNSCLHRGTKLKPSGTSGWGKDIQCPFHGWTWELDGTLNEVPCSWEFPHLDYEANRLPEVKVDTWNGFVFINMDENAEPLLDYLEVLPEHFRNWRFENWYTAVHVVKELSCNWKAAMEAFMEAYHTPLVHPEMTHVVGDWNMQHDIFGDNISRDLCPMAVSSPTSEKNLSEQDLLDSMLVGDPETAKTAQVKVPDGSTARIVMASQMRQTMADMGIDLTGLSDAEVIDSLKYNIFPNTIIYGSAGLPQLQIFKPNGMDPDSCLFEVLIFRPVPPGQEPPDPVQPTRIDEATSFCAAMGEDNFLGAVLDQDTQIMRWQREGMQASKKGAETLANYQEARIRRIHETLMKYINR